VFSGTSKSSFSSIRVFAASCFAVCLCLLVTQTAIAQTGKDTTLWRWTPAGAHHDAIVSVHSDGGVGTGVIVKVDQTKPVGNGFEGWCMTAWHVVSGDNGRRQIKVKYRNGSRARKCKVIRHDEQNYVGLR